MFHLGRKKSAGDLVKWYRGRLDREDVGLPDRPRAHKDKGLTQEDVGDLIGYSSAMIGAFERGNLPNPSPQFLDALAVGLRIPPDERRFLWEQATGQPPPVSAYATGAFPELSRLSSC